VRDVILNNFLWKMIALCLGVLAWFGFQTREMRPYLLPRTEHTRVMIAHPVTISKPATDTREFKVTPAEVEITIKGDEKTLKALSSSEVRATVEISEFREGTNSLEIHVYVPPRGVELVRLVPDRVQVEVIKQ
jgi:YbbR domain-containing protein